MNRYYKKLFIPFVLPALFFFTLVIFIPFVTGIFYSFTAWRGTYFVGADSPFGALVGFENYAKAIANEKFRGAFVYTIQFTLMSTISVNIASLALALMLSKISKGTGALRTIFFMPNLLGGLTLGFIWQFIFQIVYTDILFSPQGVLHIEALRYMTQDPVKNLFALTFLATWQYAGYMMIIYTTGLNNIPEDLYESAGIDGATAIQRFFKITVPMLMPSFTIVLFLTMANAFKVLDQNVALTDGNFGTRLLSLQILRTIKDIVPPNYGIAQAEAVMFFIVIATITLLQVSFTKRREIEA